MARKRQGNAFGLPTLAAFVELVAAAVDQHDLARAVAMMGEPLNLPTIMAGAVYVQGSIARARFYFGNWPAQWMARYTADVLADDPLVGEARRRIAPFTWRELQAEGELSPEMRAAFGAGAEAGWTDGLAVPIHGPAGYTALVSYAGRDLSLKPLDRALLRAVAHAAHDRSREIFCAENRSRRLTRREAEVMRWVAAGKSDWDVGQILGISERTAHFHVEQVKRKLAAKSRTQAVANLILRGDL